MSEEESLFQLLSSKQPKKKSYSTKAISKKYRVSKLDFGEEKTNNTTTTTTAANNASKAASSLFDDFNSPKVSPQLSNDNKDTTPSSSVSFSSPFQYDDDEHHVNTTNLQDLSSLVYDLQFDNQPVVSNDKASDGNDNNQNNNNNNELNDLSNLANSLNFYSNSTYDNDDYTHNATKEEDMSSFELNNTQDVNAALSALNFISSPSPSSSSPSSSSKDNLKSSISPSEEELSKLMNKLSVYHQSSAPSLLPSSSSLSSSLSSPSNNLSSLSFDISALNDIDLSSISDQPANHHQPSSSSATYDLADLDQLSLQLNQPNISQSFDLHRSNDDADEDYYDENNDDGNSSSDRSSNKGSIRKTARKALNVMFNIPKEELPKQPLSYDDFFRGLRGSHNDDASNSSDHSSALQRYEEAALERGTSLLRSFAVKFDMNKRGMKRTSKKSYTLDLHGRTIGVYQMEDANFVGHPIFGSSDFALFSVFDGHVGKEAAEFASSNISAVVEEKIKKHGVSKDMSKVLRESFLSLDEKMKKFELEGTTATVVLIWKHGDDRYLQSANVGDSTSFLSRDDKAVCLSKDHKVNDQAERERLIASGMEMFPNQNRINGLAVSRALGDHLLKLNYPGVIPDPFISDVYQLRTSDDKLIIASDGLWDIVSGQSAINMIKDMKEVEAMAKMLVTKAVSSPKCNDNVTVIVVLL